MGLSKHLSKGVGCVNRETHARFGRSDFASLDPPWRDMRPRLRWQGAPTWRAFSPQLSPLPEARMQPAQAHIESVALGYPWIAHTDELGLLAVRDGGGVAVVLATFESRPDADAWAQPQSFGKTRPAMLICRKLPPSKWTSRPRSSTGFTALPGGPRPRAACRSPRLPVWSRAESDLRGRPGPPFNCGRLSSTMDGRAGPNAARESEG
jgi:hypothetical protein